MQRFIIWDINEEQLQIASKEINSSKLSFNQIDVSNFDQVNKAAIKITSSGKVDILINNAGITGRIQQYGIIA